MNIEIQLVLDKILMAAIGLLLLVAGITDIRTKQISRKLIVLLLFMCCAVIPFKEDFNILDAAGGVSIGLCAIGLSIATREQIGKGDGMVIAIMGIALGARKCLLVVVTASFIMCVAAIFVLMLKRGGRQTKLPFLPAVFAGYLLCMVG